MEQAKTLPIGYPKSDGEILILNAENNPEQPGELAIVGDHVSIGYINREDLNATRFYSHNGKRAHKTGDWGFYQNGLLQFVGRQDDQSKLRGYRIELNEISEVLTRQEFVRKAVTLPLRSGGQVRKLVAFVKLDATVQKTSLVKEKLFAALYSALPDYIVPGDLIFIDQFPLNQSAKIVKQALTQLYIDGQN
jgi:D-alanine--poly(phosphoribitol) ligase subunit 1